jgi:hypothetical protein
MTDLRLHVIFAADHYGSSETIFVSTVVINRSRGVDEHSVRDNFETVSLTLEK